MKVLNHIPSPTFFSHLSRSYSAQSLASNGFYRAYNSYPSSTIICNSNQIFSTPLVQYNSIPPSINYSYLPIVTNPIPANYYSCPPLSINYSVPHLSYGSHYNLRSTNYSSLPIRATYSGTTYQSLNPPIPPIFYAPQSSNLSHNFALSNSSNYNLPSYSSNQVAVDSNPPIQFTDNFSMPIKKADDSYDTLNLKQIAGLVPNGFTGGILEPEIDSSNNKLKICNSVILTVVQRKIWIRNGDNLVELPNHLLEKNLQISNKNLDSSPKIYRTNIHNDTRFDVEQTMPFSTIMTAFHKLNKSLIRVDQITKLEREILEASPFPEDLPTSTQDKELTSISNSTTSSSPLSLSLSPSPSPPSSSINPKFEIMIPEKMVNGEDLKEYGLGSKFIIRLTKKPELTGETILC
jgi:hypothetical protein